MDIKTQGLRDLFATANSKSIAEPSESKLASENQGTVKLNRIYISKRGELHVSNSGWRTTALGKWVNGVKLTGKQALEHHIQNTYHLDQKTIGDILSNPNRRLENTDIAKFASAADQKVRDQSDANVADFMTKLQSARDRSEINALLGQLPNFALLENGDPLHKDSLRTLKNELTRVPERLTEIRHDLEKQETQAKAEVTAARASRDAALDSVLAVVPSKARRVLYGLRMNEVIDALSKASYSAQTPVEKSEMGAAVSELKKADGNLQDLKFREQNIQRQLSDITSSSDEIAHRASFAAQQLATLATDDDLRDLISQTKDLPADQAKGVAAQKIREDLAMAGGESVTNRDIRRAMIGALTTPLRQGNVGDCFVVQQIIQMQKTEPAALVRHLNTMIEKGYIEGGRPGVRHDQVPTKLLARDGKSQSSAPESNLLRTFEFTLANATPKGDPLGAMFRARILEPALKGSGLNENKIDDFMKKIESRMNKDFHYMMDTREKSSSKDGHSTHGGFVLNHYSKNNGQKIAGPIESLHELNNKLLETFDSAIRKHNIGMKPEHQKMVRDAIVANTNEFKDPSNDNLPIWKATAGGRPAEVASWLGKDIEDKRFTKEDQNKTPEKFLADLISFVSKDLKDLNQKTFTMRGGGHAFVFEAEAFRAASSGSKSPADLIDQQLKNGKTVRIGDLNWESNGLPVYLSIGKDPSGNAAFGYEIGESGIFKVEPQAKELATAALSVLVPKPADPATTLKEMGMYGFFS